jgi:hypothetical protein
LGMSRRRRGLQVRRGSLSCLWPRGAWALAVLCSTPSVQRRVRGTACVWLTDTPAGLCSTVSPPSVQRSQRRVRSAHVNKGAYQHREAPQSVPSTQKMDVALGILVNAKRQLPPDDETLLSYIGLVTSQTCCPQAKSRCDFNPGPEMVGCKHRRRAHTRSPAWHLPRSQYYEYFMCAWCSMEWLVPACRLLSCALPCTWPRKPTVPTGRLPLFVVFTCSPHANTPVVPTRVPHPASRLPRS